MQGRVTSAIHGSGTATAYTRCQCVIRIRILILALALMPLAALGQAWPSKPIRLIAPYPPGGQTDLVSR